MKKINIENSDNDAIKYVVKTFSKLKEFFPKENTVSVDEILSENFSFDEKSKGEVISFIYKTTKNLIEFHLNDISKKINSHPKVGKDIKESFNNERLFLNSLHSPATTMKEENFFFFKKDKIMLDKTQFINESLFNSVEDDLKNLFKKQLNLFKNHVIFDVIIYQIDNNINDTYFIKNEGLKFIEEKNMLNNEKDMSEKYVSNIFKSLDFFEFDDETKIKTIDTFEKLFKDSYFKSNREEIIEAITYNKAELLSLPGMIEKYSEIHNYNDIKIEKFNWDRFFSYADERQLLSALNILSNTDSFKEDIELMKKSESYDIFSELKERNSIIGTAFKHLFEIKNEGNKNHVLDTINLIERFVDSNVESSEKIIEQKKEVKRTPRKLKVN